MRGVIYPPDKRIELDGGLNTKFERSIIPENESPDCLNVVWEDGAVKTREGYSGKTVSGVGSAVFDGLYTRKDNDGSETMVAWALGTMHDYQTNTFVTIPSAQSVWTAGINVEAAQYENHIFMHNGSTMPYKYNGTDFTRHGIYPPGTNSTPSTVSEATGGLTGDYQWKVTYVNSQLVESDVNSATATLAISAGQAGLSDIPVAPQSYGVNSRKLYRTVTSGTTFLLVDTINDNTTTTYSDNTADGDLGAEAPTDQGVPPNYSLVIYFKDRLFVNDPSNPNFVWYSELGNPYVFKATSFFRMGDNTTDTVRAFGIIQNTLVVFGDESMLFVYMLDTTPSNWRFIPSEKAFGCKSPQAILNIDGKLLFPAVQNDNFVGIAKISGVGTVEPSVTFLTTITSASELQSDKIEPDMFLVQGGFLGNISGIVHKNKAYISVTYGASQTINNRVYVYDFSISNLSKPQKYTWAPWSGINAKQFTILDGDLQFASSDSDGMVYNLLDGTYTDNGNAIDSYIWTKEFGGRGQDFHHHKDLKEAYILAQQPGSWEMNFVVRTNSDSGAGDTYAIDLSPLGMVWGDDWGTSFWGGGANQEEEIVRLNQSGKRFQFRFDNQNTASQWFQVHSLGFKYNRKGLR